MLMEDEAFVDKLLCRENLWLKIEEESKEKMRDLFGDSSND